MTPVVTPVPRSGATRGTSTSPAPGSIVVGVDGSHESNQALDWATDQAVLEHRPLTLVHGREDAALVASGLYPGSASAIQLLEDEARTLDGALMKVASSRVSERHGDVDVTETQSRGDARSTLVDLSRHAALLVVGSRGRGAAASALLGSVSMTVATHATCPVVVHRNGGRAVPTEGVLVGVDGTTASLPAVAFAYTMATARSCPLTVLHSYRDARTGSPLRGGTYAEDLGDEEALVAESLAGMADRFPDLRARVRLVEGRAGPELVAASEDFELLVIGHRVTGPVRSLLHDSVAATVLGRARLPVAVVPAPGRPAAPA
ncbi:universal stress protein [Jannaschia sp. R86511]|uniref:universal stress protein n=1 Tax=Jannaschia sp. R86511 TaxID=3093853 RepID=UPI0036D252FD